MRRLVRAYLLLLAVLTVLSCLGLFFLPAQLGAMSAWGAAPGWQREIAIWNLSMYILIVRTLRRADPVGSRQLVSALVVLNFLVAGNHFATILQGSRGSLNSIAGAVNAASGTLGLIALWQARIAESTPRGTRPLPA